MHSGRWPTRMLDFHWLLSIARPFVFGRLEDRLRKQPVIRLPAQFVSSFVACSEIRGRQRLAAARRSAQEASWHAAARRRGDFVTNRRNSSTSPSSLPGRRLLKTVEFFSCYRTVAHSPQRLCSRVMPPTWRLTIAIMTVKLTTDRVTVVPRISK